MQPSITLIRVRSDGVPANAAGSYRARYLEEFGPSTRFLEMPYPAYHTARDFALDFLEAVAKAPSDWILFSSDLSQPVPGALSAVLKRLASGQDADAQGAVLSARVRYPDGKESILFGDAFSLDAMESGKAAHPWLADPSWFLPFLLMKASFARALAEELVRAPDPMPAILCFIAGAKAESLLRQGLLLDIREPSFLLDAPLQPNVMADRAMVDFESGRSEAALATLDLIRFNIGANPGLDLHRSVLSAKLERYWLATHTTRRFLQNNKGNSHALKLSEALKSRQAEAASGYAAALPLLDLVDAQGAMEGEKRVFDFVYGLHEQGLSLVIGEFPLRPALAMMLACMGTPKKVVTLSPFRSDAGWKRSVGRGYDMWKAMVSRFDLEDHAEASVSIRERLAAWGDAPRPDLLYVSLHDGPDFREELAAAYALLKEGGLLLVEGVGAERPAAWKFWIESAEAALADKGRDGALSWGRKSSAPLGGATLPVTHAELWRRSRLPEPFERTMLTYDRFRNAFVLARLVDIRRLPGAMVECGVWKGGCSASMLLGSQETGSKRALWAFDSFEGLPRPTEKDGKRAKEKSDEWGGGGCESTEADFRETLFQIAGLKDENVHIRKGWFKDTIPGVGNEIGPISILRLDGDWYDSVLICLENLYEMVVPGGYIVIDDYGCWEGAQKATDEFRARLGITSPLIQTDYDERYWIKLDEKQSWKSVDAVRDFAYGNGNAQGNGAH